MLVEYRNTRRWTGKGQKGRTRVMESIELLGSIGTRVLEDDFLDGRGGQKHCELTDLVWTVHLVSIRSPLHTVLGPN